MSRFEVIRGIDGCCLILDGKNIAGAKPWGGGRVIHTWYTNKVYIPEHTCHIIKTWSDSDYVNDWNYRCSECGGFIDVYERDLETGNVISAANYCSNCGAKII